MRMRLVLDIVPDAIDRLGVINLKVGVAEAIEELAARWKEDHRLALEGEARWEGTTIVYEYRLKGARKFLGLLRDGRLNR